MNQQITLPGQLGWTPAPPDPRTLRLAAYTTAELPVAPVSANWMRKVPQWPIFANDRLGDCVFATCGHLIEAWSSLTGGEAQVTDDQIISAYSSVTGYNPVSGANDNGTVSLDALNFWRRSGIAGHKITAYVQVDHTNDAEIKAATYLFGGLFVAVNMPIAADGQFQNGKTWTPTRGTNGRAGSWGGHAMHLGAYSKTGVTFSTWGRTQKASWHWWDSYVAETYAIVSPDWLDRLSGKSPTGFNLDALLGDLRSITT